MSTPRVHSRERQGFRALIAPMPNLTRRRDRDARHESWLILYGDVHVGTIGLRSGNPFGTDQWQWRCGFYPGSHPRDCTSGTAASFDQARADFGEAWRVFSPIAQRPTSTNTGGTAPGQRGNTRCGIRDASCPRNSRAASRHASVVSPSVLRMLSCTCLPRTNREAGK